MYQSQKLIQENSENINFEYFIYSTYDCMQEILSYENEVTVLETLFFLLVKLNLN